MKNLLNKYKVFDIDLYKLRSKNFHNDMIKDRKKTYKNFFDCLKNDDSFSCNLCLSRKKTKFMSWRKYRLFQCNNCGCVSPNFDIEKWSKIKNNFETLINNDVQREIISTYDDRKNNFGRERFNYINKLIKLDKNSNYNFLDIGCGPGYFLDYLRDKGFNGRGIELNRFCVQFANEKGLNVTSTSLDEENEDFYHVITMFDVLEHLENPINFFLEINKKLKKGGYILAYTPNIHSISSLLQGSNHNMLAIFNHLCFFDKKSLVYLADSSGFEILNIEYYGLDVMDFLAMKEAEDNFLYFKNLKKMVNILQAIVDSENLSNSMRVLFKKK